MAWWFRQHYQLAPTDPRFLDCTDDDIEVDFWAHHLDAEAAKHGEAVEEFDDDDFDLKEVLSELGDDDWEDIEL